MQLAPGPKGNRALHVVLALPEAAGRFKKLRETHFVNGTRQEIVLEAGKGVYGENVIDVSVRTTDVRPAGARVLEIGKPSENGIKREILSRFPDVRMNIVTRPMRNRLGAVWPGYRQTRKMAHDASLPGNGSMTFASIHPACRVLPN